MTQYLMDTLNFIPDVEFEHGEGARLYDLDGNEWIDFFCDVGTASLGYCSPELNRALTQQVMGSVPVHAPNLYHFKARSIAAERLCEAHGMDKVFFCNSGTEAVEAAIKIARLRNFHAKTNRLTVCTYEKQFHGRTLGSLAAGDGPPYHTEGQGPLPAGFLRLSAFELPPTQAAAVILAPVLGNNDVLEYSHGWLRELRHFTEENGIALIFDEVQTGSGRVGDFSYGALVGVKPDIMTLAKGVAAGLPVGATLARRGYAHAITPGRHFSTFGGSPLGSAGVCVMLNWLESNMEHVRAMGEIIRSDLNVLGLDNVRGPGMLIAFDFHGDCLELAKACREQHLLIGAFRPGPGAVKITPPLNITGHELGVGMGRLEEALNKCS